MPNLFVFTAGNPEAQANLEKSGQGFYAWGATPGPQNEANWNQMATGDWVLCVYGNAYRYVAQILAKFRNARFAKKIWGSDTEGDTWEYMYFLTKPAA
jgi:hypothetical protein